MHSALPPEIWALILEDLSTKSLKALCLVSRSLQAQARRRMYRTLVYCDGLNRSCCSRTGLQRIRDFALFHQSLVKWDGYRDITKHVRIDWTHGIEWRLIPAEHDLETEAQQQFNQLVKETAVLLSKSSTLRSLHLGIPLLTCTVPFHVDRITSLRIPISGCQYERDDPGFTTLLKLFQIPTLRRVQLDCMLRLCCVVPATCRQPGTSNVTELEFLNCGPISEELIHLLSWPAEFQTLLFDVADSDDTRPYATPNASVDSDKMAKTLLPFKDTIQVLSLQVFEMSGAIPDQTGALHSFSKLRWLKLPREFLLLWAEDVDLFGRRDIDPAPPVQTQLPRTLETLHIDIGDGFTWVDDDDQESKQPARQPSETAKELLGFLADLAVTPECFPVLRELWLWTLDYEYAADVPLASRPRRDFPLDCAHTWRFVRLLEQRGIDVYFDGYRWSELKG